MAFVREKLTPEQGEELYKKHKLINPVHHLNLPVKPMFWAFDRERDAYLVGIGSDNHTRDTGIPTDYMALFWKGKQIDIEFSWEFDREHNIHTRGVSAIKAPAELIGDIDKKLELEAIVKEAVICFWTDGEQFEHRYRQHGEPIAID